MGSTILAAAAANGEFTIQRALEAVRGHLGMDVAYLSEFVGDQSVFRAVDAPGLEALIKPGDSRSLDDVYCRHIVAGRLPELIPDTALEPLALSMPITQAVPIGSHVSIPIRLPDGSLYGMFCCLSAQPNPSLNDRDLDVMRMFAGLAAHQVSRGVEQDRVGSEARQRILDVIEADAFTMVYQPICDLKTGIPIGYETLCRFTPQPYRSPDRWFQEAAGVGLGLDLELAVLERAVADSRAMPSNVYVSFNAAPETIMSGRLPALFAGVDCSRIVIEVTEHAPVGDYGRLRETLMELREMGIRLAIDDAGAGFSSLQHIVQLNPDIIKLDIALSRNIDGDTARRALASALIYFSREMGCSIVAEGIETEAERDTLRALGVSLGQGYLLGRPTARETAMPASVRAG